MAHLKACGEWELSALDRSHPVVACATMAELDAAMAEASRLLRCPLEGKVERWLNGVAEFSCGRQAVWTPLREARHANLEFKLLRSGFTFIVHNAIEAFQVCYRSNSLDKLYHVQPLSAPESAAYFLFRRATGMPMRMEAPIGPDFTPSRNPYGSMHQSMLTSAIAHTRLGDIPEWEKPLHDFILLKIP